jgi:hypothetical protein
VLSLDCPLTYSILIRAGCDSPCAAPTADTIREYLKKHDLQGKVAVRNTLSSIVQAPVLRALAWTLLALSRLTTNAPRLFHLQEAVTKCVQVLPEDPNKFLVSDHTRRPQCTVR